MANDKPNTEKTVDVRLLHDYVPADAKAVDGVYTKVKAGEVVKLPRDEAKRVLDLKIAEITADLV